MIINWGIGRGWIDAKPLERMVLREGEFVFELQIVKEFAEE